MRGQVGGMEVIEGRKGWEVAQKTKTSWKSQQK